MTSKWRPKNWPVNPCLNCPDKVEDSYGLFCDLACMKATRYWEREAGADAMYQPAYAKGRKDYVKLSENQSLPNVTLEDAAKHDSSEPWCAGNFVDSLQAFGKKIQQDMLSQGWRKVEEQESNESQTSEESNLKKKEN